ncbi:unnamed protein product [Rhizoctonia solani]|uniref:MYND-type domain-containing protein n=1 Tax=Rhizoctonia solani TaxID=456999 RepID=A0A8H3DNR4_9AGAM|nr:unnamed protein product [Rhizoctonia solani]
MAAPQSHWGRTIDQYTQAYGSAYTRKRIHSVEDIQHPTMAAIERISKVTPNKTNHGVTLSDLHSIQEFSRSPLAYSASASPSLVSGCIRLMSTIQVAGKASPFSYEYGYLCFRTMIIALSTCLLKNSTPPKLDAFTRYLSEEMADLPLMEMLSSYVAMTVESAVDHASAHRTETFNCILGWSRCTEHPRREEIVSLVDAGTLLAILWDDREMFLKAMANTVSPGLSPVVYLLWRSVIYERYLQEASVPQSEMLMVPFVEVFWRSYLTISSDQRRPFQLLSAVNYRYSQIWDDSPKHNHLDDSIQIMRAFANQIWQRDSIFSSPDINDALNFIYHHSVPGYEVEIPRVLRATIHQLWKNFLLASHQDPEEQVAVMNNICSTFMRIGEMLKPISQNPEKPRAAKQILEMVAESRLLDLVGRMLLTMEPSVSQLFPGHAGVDESTRNGSLFHASDVMFNIIAHLGPKVVVVDCFKLNEPDWWKFLVHLQFLKRMEIGPPLSFAFYGLAIEVWKSIWESLGYSSSSRGMMVCTYARCAKPSIRIGAEYACGRCDQKVYCSARCQAM